VSLIADLLIHALALSFDLAISANFIAFTFVTQNHNSVNNKNFVRIKKSLTKVTRPLYYPAAERGFGKSAKNFATQTVITASANVLKEFWPDIRKNVFRKKDESPPKPNNVLMTTPF
jgi:hypothetical protein